MKTQSPLRKTIHYFTIMELLVSMAVFSILVILLMQVFNSTQRVWSTMSQKTQVKETAMNILNMMEADLKTARKIDNRTYSGFRISGNDAPCQLAFIGSSANASGSSSYDTNEVTWLYETKQIGTTGLFCLFRQSFYSLTHVTQFNALLNSGTVPALSADAVLFANNILALKIEPYYRSGGTYTAFPTSATAEFPVVVNITLKLLDEEKVEAYLDSDTTAAQRTKMADENGHTFTRVVVLNQ